MKPNFKVDSRKNLKTNLAKVYFKILIRSKIDFKLIEIILSRKLNFKYEIRKITIMD